MVVLNSWQSWPASPSDLESAGLHVLRVSLAAERAPAGTVWDTLTPDELARSERYVVEPPRRRFRLCRRALRQVLGWSLNVDPASLRFETERNGKPVLQGHPDCYFNVSHTGDWGVIAVSRSRHLGVDIEAIDPRHNHEGLARRFFSDHEQRQLQELPEELRQAAFYRLWTSKEAYMKSLGLGLLLPLGSFWMQADPREPPCLIGGDVREGPWLASGFHVADDVPGVVMWDGGPVSVQLWDLPDSW